jgi:putative membrane protein
MKFRAQKLLIIFSATILSAQTLFAHGGHGQKIKPENFDQLWHSWEFDPLVVFGLALTAILYAHGIFRLWRATKPGSGIRFWEASSFAAGWLAIVVALVSPLHPWGRVLFSAHMTQHEILILVAAPLLVLGRPIIAFLWAFPNETAREISSWTKAKSWQRIWKFITNGFVAWCIHAMALWIWHIPALFQATIDNDFIHSLQHMSFLFSALLFWWAIMHGHKKISGYGLAVLYMFTTALHSGLLGALLTFTTSIWYPVYATTAKPWGLTALQDQQLGGLIMWVPAGVVYIVAGVALFAGWMRESENRAAKREREIEMALHSPKEIV